MSKKKYKVINFKEHRDRVLALFVKESKAGNKERAEKLLNLAVHINNEIYRPPIITGDSS